MLARKRVYGYGLMRTVNPSQVRSGSCKTKKTQTLLTVSMCSCEQEKLAQLISSQLTVCRKQKKPGPAVAVVVGANSETLIALHPDTTVLSGSVCLFQG